MRLAVLAALVAGLLAPHAVAAPSPPKLGATNVVTASRPVVMAVTLDREATVREDGSGITIKGGGRFYGIVLAHQGSGQVFRAFRAGCTTPSCGPSEGMTLVGFVHEGPTGGVYRLAPGRYDLYVLTDGSPVSVTLRLGGPAGTTRLAPARAARYAVKDAPALVPAPAQPYYSGGGTSSIVARRGLLFFVVWSERAPYAADAWGFCFYRDLVPPAYLPGCPGGEIGLLGGSQGVFENVRFGMASGRVVDQPGEWSFGFYSAAVAGTSDVRLAQFWLDLP